MINLQSILESIREYLGVPDFYHVLEDGRSATWDYGAMLEYAVCGILLIVVVSNIFKIVRSMFQ